MTINDIIQADWHIDQLDITVRDASTTKYIMRYCIGRDVKPGRSERFRYEAECGDVYGTSGMSTLFINRIIQHCQLPNLPQNRIGLRGVLDKEIPKELLELPVWYMVPINCGHSHELHGYRLECNVNSWNGIPGEARQISLDEYRKEE